MKQNVHSTQAKEKITLCKIITKRKTLNECKADGAEEAIAFFVRNSAWVRCAHPLGAGRVEAEYDIPSEETVVMEQVVAEY